MSAKSGISSVLEYLRKGKIVGARPPQLAQLKYKESTGGSDALRYRSYNPSLGKEDFVAVMQENILSLDGGLQDSCGDSFQLIKCRDPKFFQFTDDYVLLFQNQKSMKNYHQLTALSRINHVRVKFDVVPKNDSIIPSYSHYVRNLESAFQGHESYFRSIKEGYSLQDLSKQDLNFLQKTIRPMEERSALIWNLPIHLKSHNVMDKFWFYDIKHCFKLYWDVDTGKTLHYVAFNDPNDCLKLKRNFHGIHFDDNPQNKLLVETLR